LLSEVIASIATFATLAALSVVRVVDKMDSMKLGVSVRDLERALQLPGSKSSDSRSLFTQRKTMKTITVNGLAACRSTNQSGFSLLEVIVATSLLTVAVASLAQLFAISVRANASAKTTTYASVLAQQKMEQLRGLTWGFDSLGLPLTDTTTDVSVAPERAMAERGLSPSPGGAGSLSVNSDGYCDFLDGGGRWLAGGATAPAGTIFVRRWAVENLPTNPNNTIVLQVLVRRNRASVAPAAITGGLRTPDEARLVSVKTRKAS
jgi:prepilin-type N-terminal cleavage/methylation domain-containing protein